MIRPNYPVQYSFGLGGAEINLLRVQKQFGNAPADLTDPDEDGPLDDAAQSEREYVRQRLREELKREPSEQELDEWLRQHTEGY